MRFVVGRERASRTPQQSNYVAGMSEFQKTPGAGNETVWYFAYGSNLDPDRFRSRVCDFVDRRQAVLRDYRLRFSGEVTSAGGGGAIIEQSYGDKTYGGADRIDRKQIDEVRPIAASVPVGRQGRT